MSTTGLTADDAESFPYTFPHTLSNCTIASRVTIALRVTIGRV
jgi:hypothetical protein